MYRLTRMGPDDMIRRAFGEETKVIKVPLNGSQKIEIKNVSKEKVSLVCNIHSHRFSCLNSLIEQNPGYCEFKVVLPQDNSIVIVIKDNGHVELDPRDRPSFVFEGVFRYFAKGYTQSIILRTNPDTESYRKLRKRIDFQADCDFGMFEDAKIDEFISIEPISDDKYEKNLPNNVKMLELDADGERHNAVMRKAYALSHVPEFMDGRQCYKACEILKEYDEWLRKEQQESKKSQSKRSVESEKSDANFLSENPKSTRKSAKTTETESALSQSKRSVKSEKSVTQPPKFTKPEKTTRSEMVQKSVNVDVPELKNQEKKKKKKKRCAIC